MASRKIAALAASLVLVALIAVNGNAASEIKVLINGAPIAFDVQPQNIEGRVMVPFRAIGEAIGAKADWDENTKTVMMYRDGQYIKLAIGKKIARLGKLSGPEIDLALDVAPVIVNGRTLVPVRTVSEGLHCDVKWDEASRAVLIAPNKDARHAISSQEELLAFLDENISGRKTKFSVDTAGLSQEDISMNICNYFLNVSEARTTWVNYTVSGKKYAYVEYEITYPMYVNVSAAIKTGQDWKLTADEKMVYEKVRQVADECTAPGMSEYDMEIAMHDYLARNVLFDTSPPDSLPKESHGPYGALIKGLAVCNGFSDSFKLLMDAVGIECEVVYGDAVTANQTERHAWNRVKIGGKHYLVDATWDRALPEAPSAPLYDYFNLTDEMMSADHKPYAAGKECVSDEYNYFVYNRLVVSDQAGINKAIKSALDSGKKVIFLRGENFEIGRMSFEALSEYLKISSEVKYSVNQRMNVMRIFL